MAAGAGGSSGAQGTRSIRKGTAQSVTKPALCSKTSPDFAMRGLNFSMPGH